MSLMLRTLDVVQAVLFLLTRMPGWVMLQDESTTTNKQRICETLCLTYQRSK